MSRVKNPENETVVRGVRAKPEFWKKCERTAKRKGISRNELIVNSVEETCDYDEFKSSKK